MARPRPRSSIRHSSDANAVPGIGELVSNFAQAISHHRFSQSSHTTPTGEKKLQSRPRSQFQRQPRINPEYGVEDMMSGLTKAIAHLEFSSKARLHLFDLPQEIQDVIFDFAYPPIDDFKAVTKRQWDQKEWRSRLETGKSYSMRSFPSPKVSEFLVSKRFFKSAAGVFMSHQAFENDFMHQIALNQPHCVITELVVKAQLDLLTIKALVRQKIVLPRLRSVTIKICDWDFHHALKPKIAWEDEVDAKDLNAITSKFNLNCMTPALKVLHVVGKRLYPRRKQEEERTIWKKNLHKLEEHLRMIMVKGQLKKEKLE